MLKTVFKDKRAILLFSFLALFSLVVLGGAIGNFSFHPAHRLRHEESEAISAQVGEIVRQVESIPLEKQIAFVVMLLLFFLLIVYLLPPEMRKKLLKQLLRLTIGAMLFVYLLKLKPNLLQNLLPFFNFAVGQAEASQAKGVFPADFQPPQVSNWVSYFVTLGLILLVVFLVWWGNRWLKSRREFSVAESASLDDIARAARASLRELSSGQGPIQDRIIQCYADMTRVVDARRGLFRERAMTPAEFAALLERAGLPREPVHRLTRLFETVRYGGRTSTRADVDEAIACLRSILNYCGEAMP
jgi:hypothetical protein